MTLVVHVRSGDVSPGQLQRMVIRKNTKRGECYE